jgi:PAS domain S-box-containing protein
LTAPRYRWYLDRGVGLSPDRFQRYFELGLIGMAIASPARTWVEVNEELCRMLGYRRDELLKRSWADMTPPEDLAAGAAQLGRIAAGEIDGYSMEKRWIRKDGQILHSVISVRGARRPDGAIDYFVALVQDITERKLAEDVLRRAKEAAEEVGRLKDQFLATLSHELRTPLAAILLWGRLLAKGAVRGRDRPNALRSIVVAAEAQNQLIEDLLDVSRMASGKVRLALRETDLGLVARAAGDAVRWPSTAIRIACSRWSGTS